MTKIIENKIYYGKKTRQTKVQKKCQFYDNVEPDVQKKYPKVFRHSSTSRTASWAQNFSTMKALGFGTPVNGAFQKETLFRKLKSLLVKYGK